MKNTIISFLKTTEIKDYYNLLKIGAVVISTLI